jgi:antitoxin (DNA-binding transcriptional repressor) of toxin-antitoxin stability system
MQTVELEQVPNHLLELLEQAAMGEDILIVKNKAPYVKLTSGTKSKRKRLFDTAKGQIIIADDFDDPLEDFQEYM